MSLEQLVEYIKIDSDARFSEVKQSLYKLEQKVDALLQFKWQIITGSVVVSAIFAIIIQLISIMVKS